MISRNAMLLLSLLGLAVLPPPLCLSYSATSETLRVGHHPQLFADGWVVESFAGDARHELHSPTPREIALVLDAPWEGSMSGYVTVWAEEGRYCMAYRGGGDLTPPEVTCLATSTDGVNWTRPRLGLVEVKGSKDNNVFFIGDRPSYAEAHNLTPFLDSNPAASPDERYKAVALRVLPDETGERRKMLVGLVSPDGLHWRRIQEEPIIRQGSFDSQNVAFWDSARGQYVCYSRLSREGKRSIQRSVSADFRQWSVPEPLDFGPGPLEHFYTNAITPYPRSPGLLVGFPMRFVPERKSVGENERATDGLSDAVFIASRDGLHFPRLFREAFLRPGPNPANWGEAHGNNTPAWGILETAPGELSMYWLENCVSQPRIRRGTLRTDGFVSIRAGAGGGEAVTRWMECPGGELRLNLATSAVGSVRVEVQSAPGRATDGYSSEASEDLYGDELDRLVRWGGRRDMEGLKGQQIRLRFMLRDADVYAFRFCDVGQ